MADVEELEEIARAVAQAHGAESPEDLARDIAEAIRDRFARQSIYINLTSEQERVREQQERDARIVQAAEQAGTRAAAERFGLTPRRIRQIVRREAGKSVTAALPRSSVRSRRKS